MRSSLAVVHFRVTFIMPRAALCLYTACLLSCDGANEAVPTQPCLFVLSGAVTMTLNAVCDVQSTGAPGLAILEITYPPPGGSQPPFTFWGTVQAPSTLPPSGVYTTDDLVDPNFRVFITDGSSQTFQQSCLGYCDGTTFDGGWKPRGWLTLTPGPAADAATTNWVEPPVHVTLQMALPAAPANAQGAPLNVTLSF